MTPIDGNSHNADQPTVGSGIYTSSLGSSKFRRQQEAARIAVEPRLYNPAGWENDANGYVLRFDPPLDSTHQRALSMILTNANILTPADANRYDRTSITNIDHFPALHLSTEQFEKLLPLLVNRILITEDWNLPELCQWRAVDGTATPAATAPEDDGAETRYEKHFGAALAVDDDSGVSNTKFGDALKAELLKQGLEFGRDFEWTSDHHGISVTQAAYHETIAPMRENALNGGHPGRTS